MNKSEMETKIKNAVTQLKPDDAYEKISREIENISQERKVVSMKERNISLRKISFAVVAACLVLAVGIFGFSYYSNNIAVDSVIDIDVNPSIEIRANKADKVLEVVAINNDGKDILDGMNLKDAELKVAVNALVGSMVKKGYFSELDSAILVSVENKDSAKAERIRKEIVQNIDAQLEQNEVSAPIINQSVDPSHSDDADKFAAEHKISYGKALFILNLVNKDESLDAAALAKLNIYEIAKLVKEKNIDIKDIVNYEYDDSIFENIEEQIEDSNEQKYGDDDLYDDEDDRYDDDRDDKYDDDRYDDDRDDKDDKYDDDYVAPEEQEKLISKDDAKKKAFSHAGVKAADIREYEIELDRERSVIVYEIEFKSGKYEYSYEINAENGKVVKSEKEFDD